jgi:phage N-6-adenine-methyltransferase
MADAEFSNEMAMVEHAGAQAVGRDLEVDAARALIREHPECVRQEQAALDTMIAAAAQLGRWEELERAVDTKIAQQREFATLWDERVRSKGGDARNVPGRKFQSEKLTVPELQRRTGVNAVQASRWRTQTAPERVAQFRQRITDAARKTAELKARANHLAAGTGANEWYTPQDFVGAARFVLGEIDLDPATHPIAQEWIKAKKFFTAQDDGLTKEWHGRIWLNPPYSREIIKPFIDKMVAEIEATRVTAAIVLTHSYTSSAWFHKIGPVADALCFTEGRIAFTDQDGEPGAPTQGQVFFYYGPDVETFDTVFSAFGWVVPARFEATHGRPVAPRPRRVHPACEPPLGR